MKAIQNKQQGDFRLMALFIPILVENILKNSMSTVNVFILGQYSDNAVASVGVASQIISMIIMFFTLIATGATVVISQNLGAGNKRRAAETGVVAIAATSMIGLMLGIFCAVKAPLILRLLQLKETLLTDAVAYFRIAAISSIAQAPMAALSAICVSNGKAKISMITMAVMNLLNAFGNYIVVMRPFETPLEGVQGVALMRGASEVTALLVMILLVSRMKLGLNFKRLFTIPKSILRDILKIGIPSGVQSLSYNLSQIVTTAIVAVLGAASISAKIYVQSINIYVFIIGQSLGQATAILVGRYAGFRDWEAAYKLNIRTLKVTLLLNGSLGIVMVVFRFQLMGIFTSNQEILGLAASVICIDFLVEIFRGINHTEQFSLQGAGDVCFPMMAGIISCWFISILFSYILAIKLHLGLQGCWIAFAMDEIFRGCILIKRWRSKRWIDKRIAVG